MTTAMISAMVALDLDMNVCPPPQPPRPSPSPPPPLAQASDDSAADHDGDADTAAGGGGGSGGCNLRDPSGVAPPHSPKWTPVTLIRDYAAATPLPPFGESSTPVSALAPLCASVSSAPCTGLASVAEAAASVRAACKWQAPRADVAGCHSPVRVLAHGASSSGVGSSCSSPASAAAAAAVASRVSPLHAHVPIAAAAAAVAAGTGRLRGAAAMITRAPAPALAPAPAVESSAATAALGAPLPRQQQPGEMLLQQTDRRACAAGQAPSRLPLPKERKRKLPMAPNYSHMHPHLQQLHTRLHQQHQLHQLHQQHQHQHHHPQPPLSNYHQPCLVVPLVPLPSHGQMQRQPTAAIAAAAAEPAAISVAGGYSKQRLSRPGKQAKLSPPSQSQRVPGPAHIQAADPLCTPDGYGSSLSLPLHSGGAGGFPTVGGGVGLVNVSPGQIGAAAATAAALLQQGGASGPVQQAATMGFDLFGGSNGCGMGAVRLGGAGECSGGGGGAVGSVKSCLHCGTASTPLWRNGPAGPKTLCNACGIRFNKIRTGKRKPATPQEASMLQDCLHAASAVGIATGPGHSTAASTISSSVAEAAATAADTFGCGNPAVSSRGGRFSSISSGVVAQHSYSPLLPACGGGGSVGGPSCLTLGDHGYCMSANACAFGYRGCDCRSIPHACCGSLHPKQGQFKQQQRQQHWDSMAGELTLSLPFSPPADESKLSGCQQQQEHEGPIARDFVGTSGAPAQVEISPGVKVFMFLEGASHDPPSEASMQCHESACGETCSRQGLEGAATQASGCDSVPAGHSPCLAQAGPPELLDGHSGAAQGLSAGGMWSATKLQIEPLHRNLRVLSDGVVGSSQAASLHPALSLSLSTSVPCLPTMLTQAMCEGEGKDEEERSTSSLGSSKCGSCLSDPNSVAGKETRQRLKATTVPDLLDGCPTGGAAATGGASGWPEEGKWAGETHEAQGWTRATLDGGLRWPVQREQMEGFRECRTDACADCGVCDGALRQGPASVPLSGRSCGESVGACRLLEPAPLRSASDPDLRRSGMAAVVEASNAAGAAATVGQVEAAAPAATSLVLLASPI